MSVSIIMYGCYYRLNPNVSVIIYRLWWNNLIEIVALLFYILLYAYCYNGPYLYAINNMVNVSNNELRIWMSNTCQPKLCNASNCWPYFLNAAVILGTFLTETLTSWSLLTKYPAICASTLYRSHLGLFLLQSYAKFESSAPARLIVLLCICFLF